MEILTELPVKEPSVLAIGVFDGVHEGHKVILNSALIYAKDTKSSTTVVTFDPHPAVILRPESAPAMLTTISQRLELFEALGIDRTYILDFDMELASLKPEDFVNEILIKNLQPNFVLAGSDFHFGFGRKGDMENLKEYGTKYGFEVVAIDMVSFPQQAEPISSTAIRRALAGGQVSLAAKMLGRLYAIEGEVVMGDQRGREIGFPTANIPVSYDKAWPADGVYAGWFTEEKGGKRLPCAINIGRRPTFYEHAEHSVLEAHILDFDADLYGKFVQVEFQEFIRSERRFKGVEELVEQLGKDIEKIRKILRP